MTGHLVAIAAFAAVLALWVAVQQAWAKAFAGWFTDPDGLAERIGCGSCGHAEACERGPGDRADARDGGSP